jgi:hypothetical protein
MKRELTRCHLRFATSEAYDHRFKRARNFVVERSVEEYSLDEPISAVLNTHAQHAGTEDVPQHEGPEELGVSSAREQPISVNPLRDEPSPLVIGAVKRFGAVGLVACALGSGLTRWWRSMTRGADRTRD